MRRETIRSTPSWRGQGQRRDCVFAVVDEGAEGFRALAALRVKLFFSFRYQGTDFPCALVEWFSPAFGGPDPDTGMWVVRPDANEDGLRDTTVIHIDTIFRLAHLIPVYGDSTIPPDFHFSYSLDVFDAFFVNKYIDHHSHEIAF
jgi:hypothetical protein